MVAYCGRRRGARSPLLRAAISFREMFVGAEKDDEQTESLAELLKELRRPHPGEAKFKASDIVRRCQSTGSGRYRVQMPPRNSSGPRDPVRYATDR